MLNKTFIAALVAFCAFSVQAQSSDIPRRADGKPALDGIWQAMNTADWNLEDHIAAQGPVETLGALGAVLPGLSVVKGGGIPYLEDALARRKENFENRRTEDPEAKCYMAGIPRSTYLPQPFQIFQTDTDIMMVYQYAGAVRNIFMENHMEAPVDSWMGWNNGHWEGDTLVVEVTGLNDNWLDRAGNYLTNTAKVVERFTPLSEYHLLYEATIEDPSVFSEPWTISMPLYKNIDPKARIFDFKCPEFAEEMMYGYLTKKTDEASETNEGSGENNE